MKVKDILNTKNVIAVHDVLKRAAIIVAGLVFCFLLSFLVIHDTREQRVLSNGILLLINLGIVLIITVFFLTFRKYRKKAFTLTNPIWVITGIYLILFVIQLIMVSKVYFYTGWDVFLLQFRVEGILDGKNMFEVSADYGYSVYPNNLLLFYLFYLIGKVAQFLSMAKPFDLCIYISCFCVSFSCYLGNFVIRKLSDSGLIRVLYTVVSSFFIMFSPWIIIPYSDTYGMFMVMLGFWALICLEKAPVRWGVFTFATIIGYQIKPTCIFPLFAIALIYVVNYLIRIKEKWRDLLAICVGTCVFLTVSGLIPVWVQHTFSFDLDENLEMPYTHFLMMGLNLKEYGGYNHDDFLYSQSFPTYEERKQANWDEIERRWQQYTPEQKEDFLINKALKNFNDGTFAWTKEGAFFSGYIERDNVFADWFKKVLIPPDYFPGSGTGFFVYRTVMQCVWLQVLLGLCLMFFVKKKNRDVAATMAIALVGLCLFLMLFESRARYLFLYAPIFLILSLISYEGAVSAFLRKTGLK